LAKYFENNPSPICLPRQNLPLDNSNDEDIMQPPTVANGAANPAPANQHNQQPHQNQQQFNPPPWWYNQNPPSFFSQPSQNIIIES
jgi:hypothetical protein